MNLGRDNIIAICRVPGSPAGERRHSPCCSLGSAGVATISDLVGIVDPLAALKAQGECEGARVGVAPSPWCQDQGDAG